MQHTKLYLMLFSFAMASCQKESAPSNTELISKAWKYSSIKATSNGITADVLQQLAACKKDDIIRFKSDKSVTQEEGLTKCNAADPQVISTGTWSFSADEKSLSYAGRTATLVELKAGSLRLQYQDPVQNALVDLALVPAD